MKFSSQKFCILLLILLCFAVCLPTSARADTLQDIEDQVDEGLLNIDFSQLDKLSAPFFHSFAQKIRQIVNGEFDSVQSFFQIVLEAFCGGLTSILPQLISIFCVVVICGLCRHTFNGFVGQDTEKVVSFVGVAVVTVAVTSLVYCAYSEVTVLISDVSALCDAALPILLSLVIAGGGSAASVCQPSMAVFSSLIIAVTKNLLLPLSVFGLAFVVVSNISDNVKVSKMADFLNSSAGWVLGIMFTLFSSVTAVMGISAAAVDGVSLRAAKFAARNYVPILGGYISDGMDIILAGTSLIKNAFGVVAMLLVFFMALRPTITVLCINLGLQAVAAVSEPVADGRFVKLLGGVSKCLTFLVALVVAVAFMFCILSLIAITTANVV